MTVAFERSGPPRARVPVSETTFHLGGGMDCHLRVAGVRGRLARISYVRGDYVLSGEGSRRVWVNAEPTPMLALRHGDVVRLTDPGGPGEDLVFLNALEGAFLPPHTPLAKVWAGLEPRVRAPWSPERFGRGEALSENDPVRVRVVAGPEGEALVVRRLPPLRPEEEPDQWLRVLTALAGAPHPSVSPCVDGGYLAEAGDRPPRWMASGWIQGETLEASLGLLGLDEALSLAQDAAEGLSHLHARGIVHRDVSPANVVRTPGGRAVLVDFGQARPWREPAPPSLGVVGTPGFVAPEEVLGTAERSQPAADVFGLGATLYALLTGVAPAGGQDVLETLSGSLGRPVPPRSLGVPLAPELEQALLATLEPRPGERPTAQALLQVLQHVRAQRPLES